MNRIQISLCAGGLLGLATMAATTWGQSGDADQSKPEAPVNRAEAEEGRLETQLEKPTKPDVPRARVLRDGPPPGLGGQGGFGGGFGGFGGRGAGGDGGSGSFGGDFAIEPRRGPVPPERVEFDRAIHALKEAKDDEARKKATATIEENLVKQFERDVQHREEELAAVEERLKQLRQQLEKRKTAMKEIVNLRLQTIVNDANGLGFPGDDGPPRGPRGPVRRGPNDEDDFGPEALMNRNARGGPMPARRPEARRPAQPGRPPKN